MRIAFRSACSSGGDVGAATFTPSTEPPLEAGAGEAESVAAEAPFPPDCE